MEEILEEIDGAIHQADNKVSGLTNEGEGLALLAKSVLMLTKVVAIAVDKAMKNE